MATDAPAHSAADYGLDETTLQNFLANEGITVMVRSRPAIADDRWSSGSRDGRIIQSRRTAGSRHARSHDTGNGKIPELPEESGDPLFAEVSDTLFLTGATPIFAVTTDQRSTYEALEVELGRGVTVTVENDGRNIRCRAFGFDRNLGRRNR